MSTFSSRRWTDCAVRGSEGCGYALILSVAQKEIGIVGQIEKLFWVLAPFDQTETAWGVARRPPLWQFFVALNSLLDIEQNDSKRFLEAGTERRVEFK